MTHAIESRIKKLEQFKQQRARQSELKRGLFGLTERETEEATKTFLAASAANIEPQLSAHFFYEQQTALFKLIEMFRRLDEEF